MRGPRLLAAAALIGLTSVSACTSDAAPEPAPPPSESVSPSPSASPSATAPTLPAEATGTSAQAAKAFARHYIDAVNYATANGSAYREEKVTL